MEYEITKNNKSENRALTKLKIFPFRYVKRAFNKILLQNCCVYTFL